MTGRQLLRRLRANSCEEVRQRGSHVRVRCGRCRTTVAVHFWRGAGTGAHPPHRAGPRALPRKKVVGVKSYRVTYERDPAGWWVAAVREVPGCHTQGRTLAQARRRIREALGLFVA